MLLTLINNKYVVQEKSIELYYANFEMRRHHDQETNPKAVRGEARPVMGGGRCSSAGRLVDAMGPNPK